MAIPSSSHRPTVTRRRRRRSHLPGRGFRECFECGSGVVAGRSRPRGVAYVFYENGLSINGCTRSKTPASGPVGFKLSDGMEVPTELAEGFKFARQKSKLAGTIRGSFFVIKGRWKY